MPLDIVLAEINVEALIKKWETTAGRKHYGTAEVGGMKLKTYDAGFVSDMMESLVYYKRRVESGKYHAQTILRMLKE